MKHISHILIPGQSLTVILNGKLQTIESNHPNFNRAVAALKANDAKLLETLLDIPATVNKFSAGKVVIRDNSVFYGDEQIHGTIVDRILYFMQNGHPFQALLNFLEKLMENPSFRSREQLYVYLERYKLPIDNEGNFLAYKAVKNNFTDKRTGAIDNSIGKTPEMDRSKISDDASQGCHVGLHVGNFEYVKSFGGNDDKFILVKVNPKDVVSVPLDSSYQKMRVARYEVLAEVPRDDFQDFESHYAPSNKQFKYVPKTEKKVSYHNFRVNGKFAKKPKN